MTRLPTRTAVATLVTMFSAVAPAMALTAVLAFALGAAGTAIAAAPTASVTGVTYAQGSSSVDVVVAVPESVGKAAHRANFTLVTGVTYLSVNGTLETIDSGRVPISDTTPLWNIDEQTVAVLVQVPLGLLPPPGGNPNFTTTIELLRPGHPASNNSDEDR